MSGKRRAPPGKPARGEEKPVAVESWGGERWTDMGPVEAEVRGYCTVSTAGLHPNIMEPYVLFKKKYILLIFFF